MQIDKLLKGLNGRYIFLICLTVISFVVLILHLARLQLSNSEEAIKEIQGQSLKRIRVPAVRGRIESADGKILVDNKVSYDLIFYVEAFRLGYIGKKTRTAEYMETSLKDLSSLLDLESSVGKREILDNLLSESRAKNVLIQKLSYDQKKLLEELTLPAFILLEDDTISLDYSKVTLLSNMSWRERTAEKICREIDRVNSALGRPLKGHRRRVMTHLRNDPALPYKALVDLNPKELALISEMIPKLSGTSIESNTRRTYPFGLEYSHLLGTTRKPDFEQLAKEEKQSFSYYVKSLYGVQGLEKKMDHVLTGKAGKTLVQVNISGFKHGGEAVKHHLISDEEAEQFHSDPINGNNVILTLDHEAQTLAYRLLKNIPQENLGTKLKEGQSIRGSFVLMDCQTGEIKAMVSTPSYNLNRIRETEYYQQINNPEIDVPFALKQQPLISRALSAYEPGSIIKPLLALAGLEFAGLDPDEEKDCEDFYTFPNGKKIREASRWPHGFIDLGTAIEQSCNKYFIDLGIELGVDGMNKIYMPAGLGRYPMALNDKTRRFTQERLGLRPGQSKDWYLADTAYSSIGQGKITVSPLQAAVFVAAIANGGKVLQPQLIKEIRDSNSKELIKEYKFPVIVENLPVKSENIEIVQQGMRQVIVGERASATTAQIKVDGAMELAGKTGTAEVVYADVDEEGKALRVNGKIVFKKLKNTWFTAFGPYENPKYVAICFVQGGYFGGRTCAPVVREFFDTWSMTRPKKAKKEE